MRRSATFKAITIFRSFQRHQQQKITTGIITRRIEEQGIAKPSNIIKPINTRYSNTVNFTNSGRNLVKKKTYYFFLLCAKQYFDLHNHEKSDFCKLSYIIQFLLIYLSIFDFSEIFLVKKKKLI